jgi:hypothetical protein
MIKIPNKLVIFGAVAAAALVVPAMLGPLALPQAYADHTNQSNRAINEQTDNVLAVGANVQANVDVDDVNVCVIARTCQ